jgi:Protein of unknown function (DUF3099)
VVSRSRVRGRSSSGTAEVYRVTQARRPHSDDQHSRTVKYLVSMSIRTVCFVLLLVTPSPWRWFFVAGAVVLPYVAVIIANAGVEQRPSPLEGVAPPATPRLEQRRSETNEPGGQ